MNDFEEDFEYSKNVFMSNDEILKFLNMGDADEVDENEENEEAPEAVMPCDINFDKLRRKMNDILGNGMVMKLTRREGVGEKVPDGAQVSIKYIGYFEYQDEPFDSSYAHGSGPDVFRLGQGQVIPGLDLGISTMRKHEISVFLIKADYAYGPLGCQPRIPPNQEVLFAVYLTDFIDHGTAETFNNLSVDEQKLFAVVKKRALTMMVNGNENYRKEKTRQAIRDYSKVVSMLEGAQLENDEEEEEQKKLLTRAYGNLAVCYNKENRPRNACVACQKVPYPNAKTYFQVNFKLLPWKKVTLANKLTLYNKLRKSFYKALAHYLCGFSFGRALLRLGEFEKAKDQLWKARELEPNNKQTLKEIKQADDMHVKYKSAEKRLWTNCLKITKEEAARTEFEKAAYELCETFKNDIDLIRQPLPDGLTPDEDQCIREVALSHGLSITNHKRYGKEIVFLTKPNY
ncbi:inactive peptidyl-prolyl cis-trans isomerase FKBP6-like isoform X2 [Belonocnema kinseyi]|nr:inactive peptidyl-prolyl cis-trans isomerase FKBP6-like isoform X2 [Belonocnema kinseyi]